jgi:hypothetical protein
MENGWASRQVRQENAVGNWTFRLSEVQETIPRSAEQKEDLSIRKLHAQMSNCSKDSKRLK